VFCRLLSQIVPVEAFVTNHHDLSRIVELLDGMISLLALAIVSERFTGSPQQLCQRHELGAVTTTSLAYRVRGGCAFGCCGTLITPRMRAINQSNPVFGLTGNPSKHLRPKTLSRTESALAVS